MDEPDHSPEYYLMIAMAYFLNNHPMAQDMSDEADEGIALLEFIASNSGKCVEVIKQIKDGEVE